MKRVFAALVLAVLSGCSRNNIEAVKLAEVLLHMDDEAGALTEYSKAIMANPGQLSFYGPLAELYIRLNYVDLGEQVLKEALAFAKEGDKALWAIHSLLGDVYDRKGDA